MFIYAIIEYIEGTPKVHSLYDYQVTAELSLKRQRSDPVNKEECLDYDLFRKQFPDTTPVTGLWDYRMYLTGEKLEYEILKIKE